MAMMTEKETTEEIECDVLFTYQTTTAFFHERIWNMFSLQSQLWNWLIIDDNLAKFRRAEFARTVRLDKKR
jgi:hypothetical protein